MTEPGGKPTAGVLQIRATATQKPASNAPAKKIPKPPAPRLKLLIRRLPPGMTQAELETALGQEWQVGAGKVDWLSYKPGKVSKDPAKPSRPSRAYIHLVSNEHVTPLSDQVRQASYQDARHTSHDPVLLGPPTLEFAPYAKTPGHRVRKDARQGTIDQDPDFIAFLESLTLPVTKPSPVEGAEVEEKKEAVLTTPLVQYIKEKKANKAKDGSSKASKRSEKDTKQEKVQAKKLLQRTDKEPASAPSDKKTKAEKPGKESTKAAKATVAATKGGKTTTQKDSAGVTVEKKRERGNVAGAAKILQRDLGLPTGGGRRRGKGGSNENVSPKTESSRDSSTPAPEGTKRDTASKQVKGTASAASSTKAGDAEPSSTKASTPDAATTPTSNPPPNKSAKGAKPKPSPSPAPTSTQAFLKHANPSQGVTEALLETAFAPFGTMTKVEIDKKKGFGYVDFAEPEGLQKAMAASPVSVAQSQVVVLERKLNPSSDKPRKGRGDSQQPSGSGSGSGSVAKAAEGVGGGNQTSSRGSRGGRGSRNKGNGGGDGSKGGRQSNGQGVTPAEKPAEDAT